jgi:hypothetical protein
MKNQVWLLDEEGCPEQICVLAPSGVPLPPEGYEYLGAVKRAGELGPEFLLRNRDTGIYVSWLAGVIRSIDSRAILSLLSAKTAV